VRTQYSTNQLFSAPSLLLRWCAVCGVVSCGQAHSYLDEIQVAEPQWHVLALRNEQHALTKKQKVRTFIAHKRRENKPNFHFESTKKGEKPNKTT
jgi:hypothetical protein